VKTKLVYDVARLLEDSQDSLKDSLHDSLVEDINNNPNNNSGELADASDDDASEYRQGVEQSRAQFVKLGVTFIRRNWDDGLQDVKHGLISLVSDFIARYVKGDVTYVSSKLNPLYVSSEI
jgi:hypothetical protein